MYAVTNPDELRALNANAKYHLPYHQSGITSSEWLENGSYLRLQTLTLGYTLPKNWLTKVHVDKIRLYLTATNLFTITGYSWFDPEVNAFGSDASRRGVDVYSYPSSRTFSLGMKVDF